MILTSTLFLALCFAAAGLIAMAIAAYVWVTK